MEVLRGNVTWIPVLTAAKLLRVSTKRVYQLCEQGKLATINMDGTVLVSRSAVDNRLRAQLLLAGSE